MEVSWPGDGGEIHTKLLVAMKDVLFNGKDYAFLGDNARERLENARSVAKNAGMDFNRVIFLGGQSFVLFPWLGTRSFRTLRRFLQKNASKLGIYEIRSEGCYYITFKAKDDSGYKLLDGIKEIINTDGIDTEELVFDNEYPIFDKYDEYIPEELLKRAYAKDRLRKDEIIQRFH